MATVLIYVIVAADYKISCKHPATGIVLSLRMVTAPGEAPVKAEFIRESDIRIHVGQVHGSKTVATPDTAVSKRQAKRVRVLCLL